MQQPKKNQGKKVDKSTVFSLGKGKIPPQATDLEEVVLGALMIDQKAMPECYEIIGDRSDVFYKDAHKHIYEAIVRLFEKDMGIDLLTVSSQLKKNQKLDSIGGDFYLIGLTQRVSTSAHMEFHCRIIMQKFVQRDSIKVANDIINNAYDDTVDIFDLLEDSQKKIDETSTFLNKKKPESLKAIAHKFITQEVKSKTSVPSKFDKINTKTGGYHAPDLVIIAARPGMGKTAYILNEIKHQAKIGIPVGFLSLEMSSPQILGRLIAEEFGIDSGAIKRNNLTISEKEVVAKEIYKVADLPIQIRDEGALSVNSAKTTIGKWVRQDKVRIVYIDYLQLMTPGGSRKYGTREQEISYISGRLKSIAKEYEICIVALSQLSRGVEHRGGSKRPMLSDLRESGAIEQDADVVKFLYRPEYYKIDEWGDGTPTAGQCEIDIAKIREGEVGPTLVACNLKYMRFEDLDKNQDDWRDDEFDPASPSEAFEYPEAELPEVPKDQDDDLPF